MAAVGHRRYRIKTDFISHTYLKNKLDFVFSQDRIMIAMYYTFDTNGD